jgi:hypothetical protein
VGSDNNSRKGIKMKTLLLVALLGICGSSHAGRAESCQSHATTIPGGKHVCFESSKRQYMCNYGGKLEFVQKIMVRSQLEEKSMCHHVDRTNDRPAAEQIDPQSK